MEEKEIENIVLPGRDEQGFVDVFDERADMVVDLARRSFCGRLQSPAQQARALGRRLRWPGGEEAAKPGGVLPPAGGCPASCPPARCGQ